MAHVTHPAPSPVPAAAPGFFDLAVDARRVGSGVLLAVILGLAGMYGGGRVLEAASAAQARDIARLEGQIAEARALLRDHAQHELEDREKQRAELRGEIAQARAELIAELRDLRAVRRP